MPSSDILNRIRRWARRLMEISVARGVPPAFFGYRCVASESASSAVTRSTDPCCNIETVHSAGVASNPLPINVLQRGTLPRTRGWWHYSFYDVPERESGETTVATLPDCRIVSFTAENGDFWVGVLNDRDRSLRLREFHFREGHRKALKRSPPPIRRERVTWLLERVYNNYSHWLTAHLPKFLLMKQRGQLDGVMLPVDRPAFVDDSLRMFGLDPERFEPFEPGRTIEANELTIVDTDRFRPELLRLVQELCPIPPAEPPVRRVYISRARASRRRLLNEDEIWPILEEKSFERVFMEDLSFEEQVRLMRQTSVLVAPHGAGLTNMMFCPRGVDVVEIAGLAFPNPNFYAVASAMRHRYWIVDAEDVGDVHPLEKDLVVGADEFTRVLNSALLEAG